MSTSFQKQELRTTLAIFTFWLQQRNVWPHTQKIGERPIPLTADEVERLRREFVEDLFKK